MAKPGILCKLTKGKVIDSQAGFVDTFNWMVDFINGLTGEDGVELDRRDESRPVIRGGGSGGAVSVAAEQIVVASVTYTDGEDDHPYCIKVERGRLALGDNNDLVVDVDDELTHYIQTEPHNAAMDGELEAAQ